LIVTLYLSNNTPIDDWKRFVLSRLGTFAPKFSEEYSIVLEEGCNTIPIILAGDFNIDLKKENETFVCVYVHDRASTGAPHSLMKL
jgi:hypothetical protein